MLASLPDSFEMLVTALEANTEVPNMETIIEPLLLEEQKLKKKNQESPLQFIFVSCRTGKNHLISFLEMVAHLKSLGVAH